MQSHEGGMEEEKENLEENSRLADVNNAINVSQQDHGTTNDQSNGSSDAIDCCQA